LERYHRNPEGERLARHGGAGFPTGNKWEIVRNAPGKAKYIVCNADESEPGTIKDRFIMETVPHLVIEGMITAGLVTGAQQGILYIRHEYEEPRRCCQKEIERCYQAGLLGKRILGSNMSFDLEIFVSPGGYICGEESALLEAIEGKRAEPRNKPPFPARMVYGTSRPRSIMWRHSHLPRPSSRAVPTGSRRKVRTAQLA